MLRVACNVASSQNTATGEIPRASRPQWFRSREDPTGRGPPPVGSCRTTPAALAPLGRAISSGPRGSLTAHRHELDPLNRRPDPPNAVEDLQLVVIPHPA